MISIIICTYRPDYLKLLIENLKSTVGVPYEIITIDNSDGKSGINEAYNCGVRKSNFEYLCFLHEDVAVKTSNWGRIVIDIFEKNPNLGLLGVAGSSYKTVTPSHWSFHGANMDTIVLNIIQRHKNGDTSHYYLNPNKEDTPFVAVIDGLWFCTTKKIATEIPFDEVMLTGFHGYDVDYSLSVGVKYQVAVTLNILVEHFSAGNYNREWIEDILKVHKKWRFVLPISAKPYDAKFRERSEKAAFMVFIRRMIMCNYSLFEILKLFQFQNRNFQFGFYSKLSLFYTILHRTFKKNWSKLRRRL